MGYSVMAANWLSRVDNFTFRNNTFGSSVIFQPPVVSNVRHAEQPGRAGGLGVQVGVTYSHNVWRTGKCGATDVAASGLEGQFVDLAGHDWHLKPGRRPSTRPTRPPARPPTATASPATDPPTPAPTNTAAAAASGLHRPVPPAGNKDKRLPADQARTLLRAPHLPPRTTWVPEGRAAAPRAQRAGHGHVRLSRRAGHGWKTAKKLHRRARPGVNTIVIGSQDCAPVAIAWWWEHEAAMAAPW